jgi:GNAT superfamily N-acetyltransferase
MGGDRDWGELLLRPARLDDVPALRELIAESARALAAGDYTPEQIEAALGGAWGVDTELIRDGTYFAVEAAGELVACGGWSRRRTLFGADAQPGRESALLDPALDAARIRAFFVRPGWARRGIGRLLIERCEGRARAAGFRSVALLATLPGLRLYAACGYAAGARASHPLPGGLTIDFVPMSRSL